MTTQLRCAKCQITLTGKFNNNAILCPMCKGLMSYTPAPGNPIHYPCIHSRIARTQSHGYVCEDCGKHLEPLHAADILNGQLGYAQLCMRNLKNKLERIKEEIDA